MAASSPAMRARRRDAARRARRRTAYVAGLGLLVFVLALVGLIFAGSSASLPSGTRIAGVDVGGLRTSAAVSLLERRAAAVATTPVVFHVAGRTFALTPRRLGISIDWRTAVERAAAKGDGFGPLRGYKRLALRFSPPHVEPAAHADQRALARTLDRIAAAVDHPHRDAKLVRIGLHVETVPAAAGTTLVRARARQTILAALSRLERTSVALPVGLDRPAVTAAALASTRRAANRVLSAPVTLALDDTRWRVPRYRLAQMLALPASPGDALRLGGPAADRWFAALERRVDRKPVDAGWSVTSGGAVRLVAAVSGRTLDVPHSAERVLAAAERPDARVAQLVVVRSAPARSTAEARAMGIVGAVGSYETIYGGEANRIHNVQLVAHLVDNKLIPPGTTFSFNGATGERSAAKGFLEAPVIINGEVQTGLGGGVCQVSTTVFNAAYEAGLPIVSRTNHALFISHYPLGRDATVNYPNVDLKFTNDTGHFLLLRTFVGPSSLVVTLFGTPQHRRVETETAPLTVVAAAPVKRVKDLTLDPGTTKVLDPGEPAQTTRVHRRVYDADGKLLSDQTWVSNYVSSPRIIAFAPKAKKKPKPQTGTTPTGTTSTATTPTATTPTATTPQPLPQLPATTTAPGSAEG